MNWQEDDKPDPRTASGLLENLRLMGWEFKTAADGTAIVKRPAGEALETPPSTPNDGTR